MFDFHGFVFDFPVVLIGRKGINKKTKLFTFLVFCNDLFGSMCLEWLTTRLRWFISVYRCGNTSFSSNPISAEFWKKSSGQHFFFMFACASMWLTAAYPSSIWFIMVQHCGNTFLSSYPHLKAAFKKSRGQHMFSCFFKCFQCASIWFRAVYHRLGWFIPVYRCGWKHVFLVLPPSRRNSKKNLWPTHVSLSFPCFHVLQFGLEWFTYVLRWFIPVHLCGNTSFSSYPHLDGLLKKTRGQSCFLAFFSNVFMCFNVF